MQAHVCVDVLIAKDAEKQPSDFLRSKKAAMDYAPTGAQLAAPLRTANSSEEANRRWGRIRSRFQVILRVMDSTAFMKTHARVFTPSSIDGETPWEQRLSTLARQTTTSAGRLVAPPDKPIPAKPDDVELQSNGEAIVNLLNNCLGSGMLSMGYAFAKAGILPALATMLLSAYLNRYTLHLNLHSNALANTDPASIALGEAAFGGVGRLSLILIYTIFGFLCCVSYIDASADAVAGLLALIFGAAPPTTPVLIGCWAVLLLPTTLLRSLKAVALLSFVAFIGGIVM